jgi:hypothetical protein
MLHMCSYFSNALADETAFLPIMILNGVVQPFGLSVTETIDAGKRPRLGRLFTVPPSASRGALCALLSNGR